MRNRRYPRRTATFRALARCRAPRPQSAPAPVPTSALSQRELTPEERRWLGPYGAEVLTHLRDHCPRAFATVRDPLAYFREQGELIDGQVALVEHAAALEAWGDGDDSLATRNDRRAAAEREVLADMLYDLFPPEGRWTDFPPDPGEEIYQEYLARLEDRRAREGG